MAELDSGGRRGTGLARELLTEVVDLRSVAELHARRLADRLAAPPTHCNPELCGADRRYIACPDFWWDDVALAWEIDSLEHHFWGEDHERTLRRNSRYAAAGIAVVQTSPRHVRDDPASVVVELRSAYGAAAARPRPAVRIRPRAA